MKILRATFDGLAGVPDLTWDLAALQGSMSEPFVVTGAAGAGKTRLLEALCLAKEKVAPYAAAPSGHGWVREPAGSAKIVVDWALDAEERIATGASDAPVTTEAFLGQRPPGVPVEDAPLLHVLSRYDHHPRQGKLEYFHARRRLPLATYAYVGHPPTLDAKRRSRMLGADEKYDAIRQFLLELCLGLHEHDPEGERGGERFSRAFGALCRSKRFEGIAHGANGQRVVFSDSGGHRYDLDHLSSAEKQAALFAATFVELNLNDSIVFVDVPELFLPEPEVPAFVDGLCRLGRNNQIFVASTSPALLARVAPRRVLRLR